MTPFQNIYAAVHLLNRVPSKKAFHIREIFQAVCQYYTLDFYELTEKTRKRNIVFARQMGMVICREYSPQLSLNNIGDYLGGFDHTTVIHGVRAISNILATEPEMMKQKNDIVKLINSNLMIEGLKN
jgi:chromosomal replication initiator protein